MKKISTPNLSYNIRIETISLYVYGHAYLTLT